jgi:hypothetical protein
MPIQLSPSDFIASFALIISLASAIYTKRQMESSRVSTKNDYRAYLSDNHKKYKEALLDVRKRHKVALSELSSEAGIVLNEIIRMFDEYDLEDRATPYLRHLLHESSEIAYCAFKGQLGWQTGLNISHRLYQLQSVEDHLTPSQNYSGDGNFRHHLQQVYESDVNCYQETELLSDHYFGSLVKRTKARIDPQHAPQIIQRMQKILTPFNERLTELQKGFGESSEYLEELLREGQLEHFSLRESFPIYDALNYTRATLNSLSHLGFLRINPEDARHYRNYTSISIHTCALLHAIQDFRAWGWRYYQ